MTGYAPAYLIKLLIENPGDKKLRGFQKFVHFPLSDGLLIAGGKGLPVGKLAMVSYDGENNQVTAYIEDVLQPSNEAGVNYFIENQWEEFNP